MTNQILTAIEEQLATLKREGDYRTFTRLRRVAGRYPEAMDETGPKLAPVTVWCSNDYLGMGQDPDVAAAMHQALDDFGAGSGGTRNISGTTPLHTELERTLAAFHGKEAALVFTSGFIANSTTLRVLAAASPDTIVFSDEKNHASMIDGIRFARCEKRIFRHNDVSHLKQLLQVCPQDRPKLVAIESLYSMEADIAPLNEICQLSKQHRALLYVDEVHAVGLFGSGGRGVVAQEGLVDQVDIVQGTLGKAFGLIGGYIAGSATLIDYVRSFGGGFIFTTSLPPAILAGAIASIEKVRGMDTVRWTLFEQANRLRRRLREVGLHVIGDGTHIIPVIIPGVEACRSVTTRLLREDGIYLQPINFPTVPRGEERVRIAISPNHTDEQQDRLVEALSRLVLRKDRVISLPHGA